MSEFLKNRYSRLLAVFGLITILLLACGQSKDTQKTYYADGKLQQEIEYKDGVPEGKQTAYYPSGKVKAESFFKGGKMDSVNTSYYEDGKVKTLKHYRNGLAEGPYQNFHENGNLIGSGNYRGGVRSGYAYDYFRDEPGKVRKRLYYFNLQGKEAIGSAVTYKKDGSVDEINPGKVLVKSSADTVKLGEPVSLEIRLADASQELQAVVLGAVDEAFNLVKDQKPDTTKAVDKRAIIQYRPSQPGLQPIRGIVLTQLLVTYSGRQREITVKPLYFEYPIYVKQ